MQEVLEVFDSSKKGFLVRSGEWALPSQHALTNNRPGTIASSNATRRIRISSISFIIRGPRGSPGPGPPVV